MKIINIARMVRIDVAAAEAPTDTPCLCRYHTCAKPPPVARGGDVRKTGN
ncbi:hypothetical protein ACFOHS_20390 [Jhaorihella thermophila]